MKPDLALYNPVFAHELLAARSLNKKNKKNKLAGRLLPFRAPARQGLRCARSEAPRLVVQPPQDRAHHGRE